MIAKSRGREMYHHITQATGIEYIFYHLILAVKSKDTHTQTFKNGASLHNNHSEENLWAFSIWKTGFKY